MKALLFINAGLMTLAAFAAAQENIPDAAPIADGPLVANPEQDIPWQESTINQKTK